MKNWKWVLTILSVLLVGSFFQNCGPVKTGGSGNALLSTETGSDIEVEEDNLAVEGVEVLPPASAQASCRLEDLKVRFPINGQNGMLWNVRYFGDVAEGADVIDYSGGSKALNDTFSLRVQAPFLSFESMMVPVFSPAAGKVVAVEMGHPDKITVGAEECAATRTNFNYITIEHENGYRSILSGLRQNSSNYSVGDDIPVGAPLGQIGASGCRYYPNINWRIQNCDSESVLVMPNAATLFEAGGATTYAGPENQLAHSVMFNGTERSTGHTYAEFYSLASGVDSIPQGDSIGLNYFVYNVTPGSQKVCRIKNNGGTIIRTLDLTAPDEARNQALYYCRISGANINAGNYTFELLIGGQVVAEKAFTIVP